MEDDLFSRIQKAIIALDEIKLVLHSLAERKTKVKDQEEYLENEL